MKHFTSVVTAFFCAFTFFSCSTGLTTVDSSPSESSARTVISGTGGAVTVNDMTNGNLTVSYTPGVQKNYARLYVSEGNGVGLVLANRDMTYSSGTYSYTLNHTTFTPGAKIYVCVLVNDGGTEKYLPQGTLADTKSWAQFTYGSDTSSGSHEDSTDIVSGGTYKVLAKCSGKALDADGFAAVNGANVQQWTWGGDQDNQKWIITSTGDGYYSIINKCSGLGLDVKNSSTFAGSNIQQWKYSGLDNQKWAIEKLSDGYYKITNKKSSKVMDVASASSADGANVQQWDWNESDAQRWGLTYLTSSPSDSGSSGNTSASLVTLNSGYEMTFQFSNNTSSTYADSSIYICCIGRNAAGNFCYLKPDGTLVPVGAGSSSASWSYKLSDLSSGMQVPVTFTSGRLYISMDKPVVMSGIVDINGNIGIVQPDLNNPSDANASTIFDWIEFTVKDGGFWGNTTQVDQFGLPVTMAMYNDSGYYRTVGIKESRDAIFREYKSEVPAEFQTLIQSPYRIIAPCKGGFRTGKAYGSYMADYVDEVWNYYAANTVSISHPLGMFNIHASGSQLIFTCTKGYNRAVTGQDYYITGKPDTTALMEGSGVLASGNEVEKALQAQMCAALNRHVAANPSEAVSISVYTVFIPCNYYAEFWHKHSVDGYAYGFCYDDVADQSPLIETHDPRGLVIGIGF